MSLAMSVAMSFQSVQMVGRQVVKERVAKERVAKERAAKGLAVAVKDHDP